MSFPSRMIYPDQELRRWDFRLVTSERSLEAVGDSVGLHIIGRSKAFDLFPRTYKGKNRCVLCQKYALINSRERTRIWLHTRHQDEAIEPLRGRDTFSAHSSRLVTIALLECPRLSLEGCVFFVQQIDFSSKIEYNWTKRGFVGRKELE